MAEENPAAQRQTAVTAYLSSERLPLFVFAWRSVCQYSMAEENPAAQRQTAVTAYFTGKQLLLFVFAWRSVCQYSMAEENPAAQRQTAVTAKFAGKQLLLFVFAWRSVCQYSMAEENPAAQRQTAVTAYFSSEQLQLFVVARRSVCQYSMAEENSAAQRQTAVTAAFVVYFSGKRQQEGGLVTRGKSKIINNTWTNQILCDMSSDHVTCSFDFVLEKSQIVIIFCLPIPTSYQDRWREHFDHYESGQQNKILKIIFCWLWINIRVVSCRNKNQRLK